MELQARDTVELTFTVAGFASKLLDFPTKQKHKYCITLFDEYGNRYRLFSYRKYPEIVLSGRHVQIDTGDTIQCRATVGHTDQGVLYTLLFRTMSLT